MSQNIFFSVGEASGDLHAAALMQTLQANAGGSSNIQIRGFGGPHMVAAGQQQDFDLTTMAVMGFIEVLPKLREFFRLKAVAKNIFHSQKIDAVVLVDFPGFNWHIAQQANLAGIPVFYYMPPQIWAWGQWRIKKMKRFIDHVLCALPMESEYFSAHGLDCELVGHPFFEHVHEHQLDQEFLQTLSQDGLQHVAVLPGSRRREVENIWPLQLQIIQNLHQRFTNLQFDVACLNETQAGKCRNVIAAENADALPIKIHVNKTSEVIEASDCVLAKSGSVSLELLARRKPSVTIYHASRSTYAIGTRLSNVKYISLPNLIAKREIIPEFFAVGNSKTVVPPCSDAIANLIRSPLARSQQLSQLLPILELSGHAQASQRAADTVFARMGWSVADLKAKAA